MHFKKIRLKIYWLFLSFILLFITACNPFAPITHIEKIKNNNEIVMGTINSSLTYSFDGIEQSGFDYELGEKFALYLNVNLRVQEYDTLNELFTALDDNKIDFIAAGLTLTPKRAQKYRSSPPYYYVSQKVVYHKGTYRPRATLDIKEPIGVLKDSSHEETLQSKLNEAPDLKIIIQKDEDQESLLRKVADKEIKFALVDSTTLAQKQRYYPDLAEAFTISEQLPVAWLINRDQDNTVFSLMVEFIGKQYEDQVIAKLKEKYFGHVENFDFVDTKIFLKRIKTTLPQYEPLFKQYATEEVNWPLLAAVSYQESHWNPKAKSPTGVRGMMMLTRATAKYLGIKNRINPQQSIEGGAKYLSQLINRLPNSIATDEKIWFALASYNLGYGHLMDARRITTMNNQNPDSWADVKDNLPLLHQKKWYKQTRYGYARGKEALHYVNNIRQYHKSLTWFIAERSKKKSEEEEQQLTINKQLAEQKKRQRLLEQQEELSNEEALQLIEKEIQSQEQALQQTKIKILKIEEALKKATEDTEIEKKALSYSKIYTLGLQDAIKQNESKALAAQKAFQIEQENILAEQTLLQQAEETAQAKQDSYQQKKDNALKTQLLYQQARKNALEEQNNFLQAKEDAIEKQNSLLQIKEDEIKEQERLQQIEDALKEQERLQQIEADKAKE